MNEVGTNPGLYAGYWKWLCNSEAFTLQSYICPPMSQELLIVTESEEIQIEQESGRKLVQMKGILFHIIQCLRLFLVQDDTASIGRALKFGQL